MILTQTYMAEFSKVDISMIKEIIFFKLLFRLSFLFLVFWTYSPVPLTWWSLFSCRPSGHQGLGTESICPMVSITASISTLKEHQQTVIHNNRHFLTVRSKKIHYQSQTRRNHSSIKSVQKHNQAESTEKSNASLQENLNN